MGNTTSTFNALTPECLEKNEQVYTDALDYAFDNNDIKNIAITGIYGAGKSTVWNTYVRYRVNKECGSGWRKWFKTEHSFDKIISVSLGQYKDCTNTLDESLALSEVDLESRVERQVINQILSQVRVEDIPLSKNYFNRNNHWTKVLIQTILMISFIFSVLMVVLPDFIYPILENTGSSLEYIAYINGVLFLGPLSIFLFDFFQKYKFRLSKVNIKGAEANFSEENKGETVLDRDIKEIVYLIVSSNAPVVVFEDLDRYNNIAIFTKLRELNFLVNQYLKSNKNSRVIKFVYMIRDGLFQSKNRTKFFDFILPIVPVVDSNTSENKLIELMDNIEEQPDRTVLFSISLYIDDMRLLRNIANEYLVYAGIIPLKKIELDRNKLFALITLKNIFPREFDLLQMDAGYIRSIFNKLDAKRGDITGSMLSEIEELKSALEFITSSIAKDKFEAMALIIPANIYSYGFPSKPWAEILKDWSQNPDTSYSIAHPSGSSNFKYEEFLNKYVLIDDNRKAEIRKYPKERQYEINRLNLKIKKLEKEIQDLDIYNYKELIDKLSDDEVNELFSNEDISSVKGHYLPLIRFLIVDGLLDETYWYYKGYWDVDSSDILKRNDIIYMKGIREGTALDVFLDIETPNEVTKRLKPADFRRKHILNYRVLEVCLDHGYSDNVRSIVDTVNRYNYYDKLISVLTRLDDNLKRVFVNMLIDHNPEWISNILFSSSSADKSNDRVFKNILISILIYGSTIKLVDLSPFRSYIENNENIIGLIPQDSVDIFYRNIHSNNIKFSNLTESDCDLERLKQIETMQAYKLTVKNVEFVLAKILGKDIEYGNLLNELYSSLELEASIEYVDNNFSSFVIQYIDENTNEYAYTNDENLIVRILKSDIATEFKLQYINNNKTIIMNLQSLEDSAISVEFLNRLLELDLIQYSAKNIGTYWGMIKKYSSVFTSYIDRHLLDMPTVDIFSSNVSICNVLINSNLVTDNVFEAVLPYADKAIEVLKSELSKKRVKLLIERDLIDVNDENIKVLLDNSYNEEILLLVNSNDGELEDNTISLLLQYELSDELIYMLVNSAISDDNAMRLIDLIIDQVLVEFINEDKENIIDYILDHKLSHENIIYICTNFESFNRKEKFISSLIMYSQLNELEDKNLTDSFMHYTLSDSNVPVEDKVDLIITKIKNGSDVKIIKEYLLLVDEIAALSNAWEHKQPALDNSYQNQIGQALIEFKYVKLIERNGKRRIWARNV